MSDVSGLSLADLSRVLSTALADGRDGAVAALAIEREALARSGGAEVQHYVLREGGPAPVSPEDYVAWRHSVGWPCRIAASEAGLSFVSTEFVGVDLSPIAETAGAGAPLVFQTVVCSEDQDLDGLLWLAATREAAETRHGAVVAAIEAGHEAVAELLESDAA